MNRGRHAAVVIRESRIMDLRRAGLTGIARDSVGSSIDCSALAEEEFGSDSKARRRSI
jgi:hypothetical protein